MTPEEGEAKVREIYRSTPCVHCRKIWCGHVGCSRYPYVRDMYDWYSPRGAYRLKPEHRHQETKDGNAGE